MPVDTQVGGAGQGVTGEAGVSKRQRAGWRAEEASQEATRHRGVPGTETTQCLETRNSTRDREGPSSFPQDSVVWSLREVCTNSRSSELRLMRLQKGCGGQALRCKATEAGSLRRRVIEAQGTLRHGGP